MVQSTSQRIDNRMTNNRISNFQARNNIESSRRLSKLQRTVVEGGRKKNYVPIFSVSGNPVGIDSKFEVLDFMGGVSAFIGTILTTSTVFASFLIHMIQRNFEHPSPSIYQTFKPLYRIAAVCYLFALSTQPTRIKFLLQRVSQIFQRKDGALMKNDKTLAKTEHTFSKDMLITPLKILAAIGDILRK